MVCFSDEGPFYFIMLTKIRSSTGILTSGRCIPSGCSVLLDSCNLFLFLLNIRASERPCVLFQTGWRNDSMVYFLGSSLSFVKENVTWPECLNKCWGLKHCIGYDSNFEIFLYTISVPHESSENFVETHFFFMQ